MKKQLTLLAALLFALTATAQIDENKQQLLDFEEDTANVVSLADILKMQQEVYSKNYSRENPVGRHPRHFLALHESGVGQNLSHREDALSAEAGYDDFLFHDAVGLMAVVVVAGLFAALRGDVLEVAGGIEGKHLVGHPFVGLGGGHLPS